MKVILAQGNPGSTYHMTRHNIGWLCLDAFAVQHEAPFIHKPKFYASIAEVSSAHEKVLLVKPTTFYNDTGRAARAILDFYKLQPRDILVLHDDLVLPFGKLRIRMQGSAAGNNGIKSLNAHLGEQYARLRIGIYSPLRDRIHDADFVLKNFSQEEQSAIQQYIIPAATKAIDTFIAGELTATSTDVL